MLECVGEEVVAALAVFVGDMAGNANSGSDSNHCGVNANPINRKLQTQQP